MQQTLSTMEPVKEFVDVPILGEVTAGVPTYSEETISGYLPMPSKWVQDKEVFLLKIKGESMKECGLHDGHRVLVHKTNEVESGGDRVIAMVNDGMTLKKIRFV